MSERELFIEYMLNENPTNNVEFMDEFGWFYDLITELRWLSWQASANREGYKLVPVDDLKHIRALNKDAIEADEKYLKEITSTPGRIVNEMIGGRNE